jgi:hypothetical protein
MPESGRAEVAVENHFRVDLPSNFGVVVRVCCIDSTQARALPARVDIILRGEVQVKSLLEGGVGGLYRRLPGALGTNLEQSSTN